MNSSTLKKIDQYIDERIQSVQHSIGITEDGIVVLSSSSECSYSRLSSEENGVDGKYEIITVKSKDGVIKGYLWNFYGKQYRSFYQEVIYDDQGSAIDYVFWTSENRPFYSTNENLYNSNQRARFSTNSEDEETYYECIIRVFNAAKRACDADPQCNFWCSITPGCDACIAASAAAACAIYN